MSEQSLMDETRRQLPDMAWHDVPVSKFSASDPTRLTRCQFCLKYFELMERAHDNPA